MTTTFETLFIELQEKIFLHCLPNFVRCAPNPLHAPLLLCHVCTSWRDIAYEMPALWDGVECAASRKKALEENIQQIRDVFAFWYGHSSSHRPFYLKVKWPIPRMLDNEALIDVAFPIRSNIRELDIDVQGESSLNAMFCFPTESMDLLESFQLYCGGGANDDALRFPILQPAPRLHMIYLSFAADHRLENLSRFQIPWSQMTHVCLAATVGLKVWHYIIRVCPLLEKLSVDIKEVHEGSEDNFGPEDASRLPAAVLTRMSELHVFFGQWVRTDGLFTHVTTPGLKELALTTEYPEHLFEIPDDSDAFRFCQQATPYLQVLRLERQLITADDVLSLLRLTPHLKDLVLDVSGDHDNLIKAFTITKSEITLVPKLEKFSLSILGYLRSHDAPTLSFDLYAYAISTRWHHSGSSAQLFQATLTVDNDHETVMRDISDVLAPLRKLGLKIRLIQLSNIPEDGYPFREWEDVYEQWKQEQGFPEMHVKTSPNAQRKANQFRPLVVWQEASEGMEIIEGVDDIEKGDGLYREKLFEMDSTHPMYRREPEAGSTDQPNSHGDDSESTEV